MPEITPHASSSLFHCGMGLQPICRPHSERAPTVRLPAYYDRW
ncbi:Uncharacterised protein [BD1-7 clade bacterium]|uniref:Uncharacterized protein n=1 Tax=BD1-7 clade bacterium TaxID=2029982 RepID=A0A5S9NY70_9GAMM|nr:Uncharacterised protein [BD1-7 clade bacterium]CAA0095818.1 Uncharacterised protein [BD1-7 clade bacterium]